MINSSKILGLILAATALLFTACAKKPVRAMPDSTQTGANGINPEQIAVPGDNANLSARDGGSVDDASKSVVEPVYFALDRSAVASAERPKIEAAVKWLKDNADKNLVLIGHCD